MDLASTQNPVQWTSDLVFPCRDTIWETVVGLPSLCTAVCMHWHHATSKLHRLLGPCFKTGREWPCTGRCQAQLPSTPGPQWGISGQAQRPPSGWCSHQCSHQNPKHWRAMVTGNVRGHHQVCYQHCQIIPQRGKPLLTFWVVHQAPMGVRWHSTPCSAF